MRTLVGFILPTHKDGIVVVQHYTASDDGAIKHQPSLGVPVEPLLIAESCWLTVLARLVEEQMADGSDVSPQPDGVVALFVI
jgi:hypothetical protein